MLKLAEAVKLLAGVCLGGCISILTTCMNNNHSLNMQNRNVVYEIFEKYKSSYLDLHTCKRKIINDGSSLVGELGIDPRSEESRIGYEKYEDVVAACYSELISIKLQLSALNVNTDSVTRMTSNVASLTNRIKTVYLSDEKKKDPHELIDEQLLIRFPKRWDENMSRLNNSIVKLALELN